MEALEDQVPLLETAAVGVGLLYCGGGGSCSVGLVALVLWGWGPVYCGVGLKTLFMWGWLLFVFWR